MAGVIEAWDLPKTLSSSGLQAERLISDDKLSMLQKVTDSTITVEGLSIRITARSAKDFRKVQTKLDNLAKYCVSKSDVAKQTVSNTLFLLS